MIFAQQALFIWGISR